MARVAPYRTPIHHRVLMSRSTLIERLDEATRAGISAEPTW